MPDPYYGWYWAAAYSGQEPPTPPPLTAVLVVLAIPLLLVAVCLALAAWEHFHPDSGLTRSERRRLARIERRLRATDPVLDRMLTTMRLQAPIGVHRMPST